MRKEREVGGREVEVDPKSGKVLMGNGHFAEKHDGKPGLHQFSTIVPIPNTYLIFVHFGTPPHYLVQ